MVEASLWVIAFSCLICVNSFPTITTIRTQQHEKQNIWNRQGFLTPSSTKPLQYNTSPSQVHSTKSPDSTISSSKIGTLSSSVQRKYETFLWTPSSIVKHDGVDSRSVHKKQTTYDINYRVEGPVDGPPILLVHGFGANVNHFRYQFPALVKEGYRVYAIDLLGFGASPKPSTPHAPYSIELWTELMVDFVTHINTSNPITATINNGANTANKKKTKWVLGGNSIGGLCCLAATKDLPDDVVHGCILFNAAGGMSLFRYKDSSIFLWPILYFAQKVILGPRLGGRFFEKFRTRENVEAILKTQGVYGDTTNVDEDLLDILLRPGEDEGAKDVFLQVFAGPAGPTPESILPYIGDHCRILALWGGADPWTSVDSGGHPGDQFSKINGNVKLVTLPGVGHCPHDEAPELCHEYMIPWMKTLGLRP